MGSSVSILQHFPKPYAPRAEQAKVLEQIECAFSEGYQFVFLEAPPGVGKSHIAMTCANYFGSTWICTLTKQLQAQYLELFYDAYGMRELKGRANFGPCHGPEDGGDVDKSVADCELGGEKFEGKCGETCPYIEARNTADAAPVTVCNYMSYIHNVGMTCGGVRPLLVLDEGHEVENVLLNFISYTVTEKQIPSGILMPEWPSTDDSKPAFEWMEYLFEQLGELESLDKATYKLMIATRRMLQVKDDADFIVELKADQRGFTLKPITVAPFGNRIFQYGQRVLLMSATILDAKELANSLGIEEYAFIRTPTPFPKENRPVYVGNLNMKKNNRPQSWPVMLHMVQAILEEHAGEKGLILTQSNEMLYHLRDNLPSAVTRRFKIATGPSRMDNYAQHCRSKEPTVLVAPGLWEGADLHGDLSRFQIIPSIPRPLYQGQVEARARQNPKWYRWRSYTKLVQGVGRSVRNVNDRAVTYVLDGELREEAERPDSMLPDWFTESLQFI